MSFGRQGENVILDSVAVRLDIIQENFITHFSSKPVWGNIIVDTETTGAGSFSHSIPFYVLSHTGLIGFVLLFLYFLMAIREFCRTSACSSLRLQSHVNRFKCFIILFFITIFAVGSISSALFWSPFWFCIGLAFQPFGFNRRSIF
jgi:hypothetical protein